MTEKTINEICWWIPNKKLRNNIRSLLYSIKRIDSNLNIIGSTNRNINSTINKIDNYMEKIFSKNTFLYHCKIDDIDFAFYDLLYSSTVNFVAGEMEDYNFNSIDFKEGDIILDIGANVGIVSIYLAKKYPFLKIYSFEPVKENYDNFIRNIEINKISPNTIIPHNLAVTKDGRDISIYTPLFNSGGSSIYGVNYKNYNYNADVKSITLDNIFNMYNIDKCKLLKVDCEGAEYEILYNTSEGNLKKCLNMRGEFHGTESNINELLTYIKKYINNVEVMSVKNNENFY